MQGEIQSDRSTAKYFTDLLGAGPRTKHINTRYFMDTRTSSETETLESRRRLQQRTAQMLERSQSLLQYYNSIANLHDWYSTDHGSHTPPQDDGDEPMMDLVTGLQPRYGHKDPTWSRKHEHRNRQLSVLIVNIKTDVQAECNQ